MSTYKTPNVNQKPPQLSDLGFWADIRFDPDDSTPTYIGLHLTKGASTSDSEWKIYKFTYSGSNVSQVQHTNGIWDNRASLF